MNNYQVYTPASQGISADDLNRRGEDLTRLASNSFTGSDSTQSKYGIANPVIDTKPVEFDFQTRALGYQREVLAVYAGQFTINGDPLSFNLPKTQETLTTAITSKGYLGSFPSIRKNGSDANVMVTFTREVSGGNPTLLYACADDNSSYYFTYAPTGQTNVPIATIQYATGQNRALNILQHQIGSINAGTIIVLPWTPRRVSDTSITIEPGSIDGNVPKIGGDYMDDDPRPVLSVSPGDRVVYIDADYYNYNFSIASGATLPANDIPNDHFYFPIIVLSWTGSVLRAATAIKNSSLVTFYDCTRTRKTLPGG